jgi:hypothetical protein
VDSPWIEWKISLMVNTPCPLYLQETLNQGRVEYGHGATDFLLETDLNYVP